MISINKENCPIEFRDYVEYNGKVYLEIMDKEVPGIVPHRYYIATDGEIYSKNKGGGIKKHRLGERYYTNEVRLADGGRRHITEHTVAMQVYADDPERESKNLEVNHINGDKYNNNLTNLEWVTHIENMHHAYEHGLNQNYCENNTSAYLTNDQVREICVRLKNKDYTSYVDLGKEYNCNPIVITRIANGKAWKRISQEVGLEYCRANSRFTDEDVHEMCRWFVQMKGEDFDEIYDKVVSELNLKSDLNMRHKIHSIYFKRAHYFTRITDQYDYL